MVNLIFFRKNGILPEYYSVNFDRTSLTPLIEFENYPSFFLKLVIAFIFIAGMPFTVLERSIPRLWKFTMRGFKAISFQLRPHGFALVNGHRAKIIVSRTRMFPARSGWFTFWIRSTRFYVKYLRTRHTFVVYRFNKSCKRVLKRVHKGKLKKYCGKGIGSE